MKSTSVVKWILIIVGIPLALACCVYLIVSAPSTSTKGTPQAEDYRWMVVSVGYAHLGTSDDPTRIVLDKDKVEFWVEATYTRPNGSTITKLEHAVILRGSKDYNLLEQSYLGKLLKVTPDPRHRNKFEGEIRMNQVGTMKGVKCPFDGYQFEEWHY